MEKLLILGIDTTTELVLQYTRREGIYTIISDMYPADSNPLKKLADETWQIDIKDLDTLEAACRKHGVTGVYNGNHDICLDYVRELSLRLYGEFYASDRAWECSRDKLEFKKECLLAGLTVPKCCELSEPSLEDIPDGLSFPLVVKPADSFASQGLSICKDAEELQEGILGAFKASPKNKVVVEEFISGDEYGIGFIFDHGKVSLIEFNRLCKYEVNHVNRLVFARHRSSDEIREEYMAAVHEKVLKLFQNIGAQKGGGFIQMIYRDHTFYPLEFGYRLDGVGSWMTRTLINGGGTAEYMVDIALHRDMSGFEDMIKSFAARTNYYGGEYFPAVRPGKIARIEGLETVKAMDKVAVVLVRFHEGDQVGTTNSMYQIAYYISIGASSDEETARKIREINDTLHLYDEDGNEMLCRFESYEGID